MLSFRLAPIFFRSRVYRTWDRRSSDGERDGLRQRRSGGRLEHGIELDALAAGHAVAGARRAAVDLDVAGEYPVLQAGT